MAGLLSAQPLWAQSPEATAELVPADTPVEIETITFEKDARSDNVESTTQILQNLENLVHDNSQSEEIINQYDEAFDHLGILHLQHSGEGFQGSGHLYLSRIPGADEVKRNAIIIKLAEQGIASNVHYKPLPMMTAYKSLGFDVKDYPNAYDIYANEITLPLHTKLMDEDVAYIKENFIETIKRLG